ncbi:MAG: hypothetical protein EXQ91_08280 [Alphaproteobacteria bacterium]|nr:hypothetical protein [Alphaproteobacteria bacterium]
MQLLSSVAVIRIVGRYADGRSRRKPQANRIGTSLRSEFDYFAAVSGEIPGDLRGTLYRNGPGLFERGGVTKGSLLDGDGMIQALTFGDAGVRLRNRFVRTPKFVAEKKAAQFRFRPREPKPRTASSPILPGATQNPKLGSPRSSATANSWRSTRLAYPLRSTPSRPRRSALNR